MSSKSSWQWPIPLESYQLNSPLTLSEKASLAELIQLREQKGRVLGFSKTAAERLPRLVAPIQAALNYGQFEAEQHGAVIYLFLKQSFIHEQVYTELGEDLWLHCLQNPNDNALPDALAQRVQVAFLTVLYLLKCFKSVQRLWRREVKSLAQLVFGQAIFDKALLTIQASLSSLGYQQYERSSLANTVAQTLLANYSPSLEDIDHDLLEHLRSTSAKASQLRYILRISYALFQLKILSAPLPRVAKVALNPETKSEWETWVQRWDLHSSLSAASRCGIANILLQVGIWLRSSHPELKSPADWTRQSCLDFVTAACNLRRGAWTSKGAVSLDLLKASSRRKKIDALRKFFQDLQDWEWIPKRFNPSLALTAPAQINAQIGPNPRIIASEAWAKLLEAAMDLTEADIQPLSASKAKTPAYPLAMVRALALIWVFGGLRNDEIRRLRCACIRWEEASAANKSRTASLRVPANKTSGQFEKAISHLAAEALLAWEAIRPAAPAMLDQKTGEMVQFLFVYRGRCVGQKYINQQLIPLLCAKAGIASSDSKGKITSHRARASMSNALVTGEAAMSLFELKAWLGHTEISSTLHYVKPTLTQLAKSFSETDYFERNLRLVDVLLDQDALAAGVTENWLHYDLGHGYCNNDFFVHCAHRMACARCSFYLPKDSSRAQMLEAQVNLRHMLQEIQLTELELKAVEGDLNALEHLLQTLQTSPSPDRLLEEAK